MKMRIALRKSYKLVMKNASPGHLDGHGADPQRDQREQTIKAGPRQRRLLASADYEDHRLGYISSASDEIVRLLLAALSEHTKIVTLDVPTMGTATI